MDITRIYRFLRWLAWGSAVVIVMTVLAAILLRISGVAGGGQYKNASFWLPIGVLVVVAVLFGLMLYVSHNRSHLVPGAIIGVTAALATAAAALLFLPDRVDFVAVMFGVSALVVFATMLGLLRFAFWVGKKWKVFKSAW